MGVKVISIEDCNILVQLEEKIPGLVKMRRERAYVKKFIYRCWSMFTSQIFDADNADQENLSAFNVCRHEMMQKASLSNWFKRGISRMM